MGGDGLEEEESAAAAAPVKVCTKLAMAVAATWHTVRTRGREWSCQTPSYEGYRGPNRLADCIHVSTARLSCSWRLRYPL